MPSGLRLIIAGGRDFNNFESLVERCDFFLQNHKEVIVISGRAKGADLLGEKYAKLRGFDVEVFEADWDQFGKAAGPVRNRDMAKRADALIAFWDGKSRGTKHMIETAKDLGLKVRIIKY
jgi:hypothetical protein